MIDGSGKVPVVVFAKPPRPGEVKTRLAGGLGAEGAAALAWAFFEDTSRMASSIRWADALLATTEPGAGEWRRLPIRRIWPQGDGDLGQRMERVLAKVLESSPAVIAIGADSPGLPVTRLDDAREALGSVDAVLGPCPDGGFYLLGLRRAPPGLLEGLPWSVAETFERTRCRLLERGLTVRVLPQWSDVDRPGDLETLRRVLVRGDARAPATARSLAALLPEPPRVSVVVPVLDEAARIGRQLRALLAKGGWHEVVVVDGGSRDGTLAEAKAVSGVRVIEADRGRARQMNAGASAATGDVLLFLHADVELPDEPLRFVAEALSDPSVVAGAFRTWTVPDRPTRLAPFLHLADLRSRYTGLPYGDQALFVRAGVFERLGGFPEQLLMEDLELSRRLRRVGKIRTVRANVRVSGRRFVARPFYYFALVNVLPFLYAAGSPPARLARLYGDPR